MSVSSSSGVPYHISTSNDHTRIHRTPISFNGQHFLTTAAQWTKKRIFPGSSPSDEIEYSPPKGSPTSSTHSSGAPSIALGQNGEAVVTYSNCVQVWSFDEGDEGTFKFVGSTYGLEGKINSGTLIPKTQQLVVEVVKRGNSVLEVHKLNERPSLESTLVLPPSSSGPGPFHIHCAAGSDYFAVVSNNHLVTLFSVDTLAPLPLSGLETTLGADETPLLDIKGRWLVISPKNNGAIKTNTTLKLPPDGPLYERLMEGLSTTAAASFKSLSDAGVAGIKAYLNKDSEEADRSHPNTKSIPLNKMFNNLFVSDTNTTPIQVVDVPTQTTICHFTPLYGVSHLSLSPHDTTLATVSLNGDHVYTYDLSFVPKEVSVTGRYVRGKLPAKVRKVVWDSYGGFGIITWEKGSLHWFDKRRAFDSTNKVWKLSSWGVEDGAFISNGPVDHTDDDDARMQLTLLKQNQLLTGDVLKGKCTWKYDIPVGPISDVQQQRQSDVSSDSAVSDESSDLELEGVPKRSKKNKQKNKQQQPKKKQTLNGHASSKGAQNDDDPLSYYEMEPCMPYPFVHEDRRIEVCVYDEEAGGAHEHYASEGSRSKVDYPKLEVFGQPVNTVKIDFGQPDGRAKFSPPMDASDNDDEIQQAMGSMVINNSFYRPHEKEDVVALPNGNKQPVSDLDDDEDW